MSDNTFAFYDADRDAVILRAESGHEIDVLTRDDAASLGRELLAAAMRQDTGYSEYLAQERGEAIAEEEADTHPGQAADGADDEPGQPQHLYAVHARFLVHAPTENDAAGQITNDLAVHPDVEEVWTEATFTD